MESFNIGQRIKHARINKGLSVEQLANKIGKNKATVYRYEKNEIDDLPYTILIPIAKALNVTPAYLIGWDDSTNNNTYSNEVNDNEPDSIDISFANNYKELIKSKNITTEELAKELHISINDLKNVEDGKTAISLSIAKKISEYFDLSMDDLISIDLESERKHIVLTQDETLTKRYKKWQETVGYNHFSDEEIDKLIEYAKFLINQRNDK